MGWLVVVPGDGEPSGRHAGAHQADLDPQRAVHHPLEQAPPQLLSSQMVVKFSTSGLQRPGQGGGPAYQAFVAENSRGGGVGTEDITGLQMGVQPRWAKM